MKPTKYLFFPTKNGEWLRDSQGKPRVYKTVGGALRNPAHLDYDTMQIFECIDKPSREEFEKTAREGGTLWIRQHNEV